MPLFPETIGRRSVHARSVQINVFSCPDGSWEIDAEIADVPQRDVQFMCGLRRAGEDLHRMRLRLLVDSSNRITRAGALTVSGPYGEFCADHREAYRKLEGMNLLKGFRHAVMEALGGMHGCTHITELATYVPTALIQAIAQETAMRKDSVNNEERQPFQLERCHALKLDGEAVRIFYPRWHRPDER